MRSERMNRTGTIACDPGPRAPLAASALASVIIWLLLLGGCSGGDGGSGGARFTNTPLLVDTLLDGGAAPAGA